MKVFFELSYIAGDLLRIQRHLCKMHPKDLQISDFTYDLPADRIAAFPLANRDASRLLVFKDKQIREDVYRNVAQFLPESSLLILNDTKVVEARLLFQKSTGGTIEIFCLSPHNRYPDVTTAMMQKGSVWWNCLVGGASKWKRGVVLEKRIATEGIEIVLKASVAERSEDSFSIEFCWDPAGLTFAEVLHYTGVIPLPPYIKRAAEESDRERYQTVYARYAGSVAAPTAGLHFTDRIFQSLSLKAIAHDFVTLHVGAGTFKPVKAERMEGHTMHTEYIDLRYELIEKLLQYAGKIFCVGTTSLRTIESLYWMGVKITRNSDISEQDLIVSQWEVYESASAFPVSVKASLQTLLNWMKERQMERLLTQTQIIIAPGYKFRMISGLITNFHQPQSTLLLLVAALIGNDWKTVYQYALDNDFRFLSYGDGCLLYPQSDAISNTNRLI